MIPIHLVIFVHTTHENKRLNLPVGGISNAILELLPEYEEIEDLKVSLITKYSEYEPLSRATKIKTIYRFIISKVNTLYFFIKSFFKIINIHKKHRVHAINIHSYYYDLITPFLIHLIFKIPLLIKPPSDFETQQREIFMTRSDSLSEKMAYYGWMKFFRSFITKRKLIYYQAINRKIYHDLKDLKIPEKNIRLIPNGISSKKYLNYSKHTNPETHYGFVGRLLKNKNIFFLLDVFSKYLERYGNDKLYIFGEGPEESNIKEFIKRNNLEKNIIFCGFKRKKQKIYNNIDVLIHPTFGEGCPNTILEAGLTRTFIIASNVSGINDIIENNKTGLLFNPFNKNDLLEKLYFFKKNKENLKFLKENVMNKIVSEYEVKIIARKVYNFLKDKWLLNKKRDFLKISILTPVFPYPKRGILPGVENYVESFAIPLKKLGHEVKIITTFWNGQHAHEKYKGISIYRILDSRALLGKLGSLFHLNYITFGFNLTRKNIFQYYKKSDVLIMPLALGFTSFLKFKNYNVISTFLHYDPQYNLIEHLTLPFYHYLEKRQFKKHKNIVTISNASKKDITKHYGIENKNIEVLPIGVDTSLFNPNNESTKIRGRYGNKTLLYVGPFVKRKRIPVLLKAMTYVLKDIPDAHLILIGNGLLLDHCKDLARNLNLNENTSFLGFIGEEKLTKYYASSDLFVFASELEGFGQVLLEAMASGTPVICTNKDPMQEIVGNGGWTFKLNDPIDLSKKIIHLLKHNDLLKDLSDKAIRRAKKYNLEEIAKKWVEIICEISNHRVIYHPP